TEPAADPAATAVLLEHRPLDQGGVATPAHHQTAVEGTGGHPRAVPLLDPDRPGGCTDARAQQAGTLGDRPPGLPLGDPPDRRPRRPALGVTDHDGAVVARTVGAVLDEEAPLRPGADRQHGTEPLARPSRLDPDPGPPRRPSPGDPHPSAQDDRLGAPGRVLADV